MKHFKTETKVKQIPVKLWDKETAQQVQALGPFLKVLHPSQKHHSTLRHLLQDQGPKGTAHWKKKYNLTCLLCSFKLLFKSEVNCLFKVHPS